MQQYLRPGAINKCYQMNLGSSQWKMQQNTRHCFESIATTPHREHKQSKCLLPAKLIHGQWYDKHCAHLMAESIFDWFCPKQKLVGFVAKNHIFAPILRIIPSRRKMSSDCSTWEICIGSLTYHQIVRWPCYWIWATQKHEYILIIFVFVHVAANIERITVTLDYLFTYTNTIDLLL